MELVRIVIEKDAKNAFLYINNRLVFHGRNYQSVMSALQGVTLAAKKHLTPKK